MKFQMIKSGVAAAVVAAAFIAGPTAQAATGTGTATARVLTPLTVTSTRDLAFGTIVPAASTGTVVITSGGTVTCGVTTCIGTRTAGQFNVTGTAGQVVTIAGDTGPFTLNGSTAGTSMTVSGLTVSAATATLTGGSSSFTVGGTLNVGANQSEGNYTGSYTVTVNYQ